MILRSRYNCRLLKGKKLKFLSWNILVASDMPGGPTGGALGAAMNLGDDAGHTGLGLRSRLRLPKGLTMKAVGYAKPT